MGRWGWGDNYNNSRVGLRSKEVDCFLPSMFDDVAVSRCLKKRREPKREFDWLRYIVYLFPLSNSNRLKSLRQDASLLKESTYCKYYYDMITTVVCKESC